MKCVWLGWRIGALVALALLAIVVAMLIRPDLFWRLPELSGEERGATAPSSLILDRNGRLLYEMIDPHGGMSRPVTLDEVVPYLQQAIVATEDATFYQNPGVDLRAVARALWTNLRSGEITSGASTITQQLARNLLMTTSERQARTWQRKVRESLLAYTLTRTMSKSEILTLYLNETYFGNMAYGVEAAARMYFAKPAAQLDLAEASLLAGLPQSPGGYDPLTSRRRPRPGSGGAGT
jgi:membrane peptidoglycan carboxypeptidase